MVSESKRRETGHARDILESEARTRSWASLEDLWLSVPYWERMTIQLSLVSCLEKIYSLLWEVVSRSGNQPFEVNWFLGF